MLQALRQLLEAVAKLFAGIFVKPTTQITPEPPPPPVPVPVPIPTPILPTPVLPPSTPVPPSVPSKRFPAEFEEWVTKWYGKYMRAPGGIGGQCVDLTNQYILDLFGFPHQWRDAVDWWNAPSSLFLHVLNDPKNLNQIPPEGAIMVWRGDARIGVPSQGHIDVVISAQSYEFTGFDQNWPIGALPHYQKHSYIDVIGWLIPIDDAGRSLLDQ